MDDSAQNVSTPFSESFEPLMKGLEHWKYFVIIFIYFSILLFLAQIYVYFIYLDVNKAIFSFISLNSVPINISNIYFNNFFSMNLSKTFIQNLIASITSLVLMWFGLLLFFLTNREKKYLFFMHVFLVIFCIAPFLISLVNVALLRAFSIDSVTGFSGVASTVVGYGLYSLLKFLHEQRCDAETPASSRNQLSALMVLFSLACLTLITVILNFEAVQLMIMYGLVRGVFETLTKTDILAHVTGFLIGLSFPALFNPVIPLFTPALAGPDKRHR
jgi:hypothetical protein